MSISTRFGFLLCTVSAAMAQSGVQAVLARMDVSGPAFRSVTGKVTRETFTAIVDDKSEESGTIAMLRSKSKEIRMKMEFTKPDVRAVAFHGQKAEIYYPKRGDVEEYDLGKHKSLVEQFLLLGFGGSGKDLQKNYSVKYAGEETIAGQKASRLELIPKSAQVKENYSKLELWIADPGGYPVRQKLYQPSGNYSSVTYSDIKWNPELSPDQLSLKLPPDVKRIYPGK
jgi:outer membrane lipoprotein-sorting protein